MVEKGQQVRGGDHLNCSSPSRLRPLFRRANQSELILGRMESRQQNAGRRCHASIETQFPDKEIGGHRFWIDDSHGTEQRHSDRQVIMRPFLWQIRRR